MLQAIKIRLYPNKQQEDYILNLLGCTRFVYNNCLDYKIKKYNDSKTSVSFAELGQYLVNLKKQTETSWLKNVHSKVLQQSLINLEDAYKSFFKNGKGFPKFKSKKDSNQSCRFPKDAISKLRGNRINIIKPLSNIHFKCSVRDEVQLNKNFDKIKSGTLTRTKTGNYYFSILIDKIVEKKLEKTDKIIGLDVGIKDFIVDSNRNRYENIKIKRNNEKKLRKLHQKLSRKQKGSLNREKARKKLSKFYEKLNNIKDHYLHQVSNKIISENQTLIIEDLNVSEMMKNKYLSKSIQELSLHRFKEMLLYKCEWYGRNLIQIDRFFPSSKLCNVCGNKNEKLKLSDREWKCCGCGTNHDRDHNAATNILKEGTRIFRLGLSSSEFTLGEIGSKDRSMNQEKNVIS